MYGESFAEKIALSMTLCPWLPWFTGCWREGGDAMLVDRGSLTASSGFGSGLGVLLALLGCIHLVLNELTGSHWQRRGRKGAGAGTRPVALQRRQ